MKTLKIAALLLVLPISSYAASTPEDCTAITSDKYRLKCYDKFFAENDYTYQKVSKSAVKTAATETAATKTTSSNDTFGFENKAQATDSISSEIVGSISKWKKGVEVFLANGQVWKVTDSSSLYKPVSNETITIEKGVFGSFFLSIEGTNKRLKVKRIK